jgi:hypothetical protein
MSSNFPGLVQAFFTDRLVRQRNASPHTIAGYRDTFRLLLHFAAQRLKKVPFKLALDDLDAPLVGAFLITSRMNVATAPGAGTLVWPRCIRFFATFLSMNPPMLTSVAAFLPFPANATSEN